MIIEDPRHLDGDTAVLSRMRSLIPEIASRAEETEADCAVPIDLLDKIQATGAFRMSLPVEMGGEGMNVRQICDVIEATAAADASTAWHVLVTVGSQVITARLPRASLGDFYATGPDTWPKAALAPKGVAVPVEGGYRLSGRWPLASGARPFEWVSVGFFIKDGDGLRKTADGVRPDLRFCLVPREGFTVIPTWNATGLRGTRSDDLEVKDVFIPEAWQASFFGSSNIAGAPFRVRMPIANGPYHVAVAIGVLRAAIEDLAKTALTRRPAFNPTTLMKDDPVFRSRFGEVAIQFESLRALYRQCVGTIDACGRENRDVTPVEAARISASTALIHRAATNILDEVISLSGAGAVYCDNPQQRRWRDIRCAAQHQSANIGSYGELASVLIAETSTVQ